MTFRYGYRENWLTTIIRAVGPTTLNARAPLPQPLPTDLNSIWLAPNGSDANPGTQGLPKLTITGAIAALTATLTTVHIFRNGYVGTLTFAAVFETLPASRTIQVEIGETATLNFSSGLVLSSSCQLNGLVVNRVSTSASLATTGITLSNCHFNLPGSVPLNFDNRTTGTVLEWCIFTGGDFDTADHIVKFDRPTGVAINNCIFYRTNITPGSTSCVQVEADRGGVPTSITFRRCYFANAVRIVRYSITGGVGATSSIQTITFNACVFPGLSDSLVWGAALTAGGTALLTINLDYCLRNGAAISTVTITAGVTVNTTETNALPDGTTPLWQNQIAALAGDAESFRLQVKGKLSPGGARYFLTSPLVLAYAGTADVGPWDETTVLVDRVFTKESPIIWDPSLWEETHTWPGTVAHSNIRGNLRSDYDGVRRRETFKFGDGDRFASNNDARRLIAILSDRGSIRFYPRGVGLSIMTDSSSGLLNATAQTFAPSGLLFPMIPPNWAGWWLTLVAPLLPLPLPKEYYILSQTSGTLTLADKLGVGFPTSGNYGFFIDFIIVKSVQADFQKLQPMFTRFLRGGAFRETADLSRVAFQLKGYTAAFAEDEDHEEVL